jgi:type I restriction-modification system DNA methylase subunit
MLLTDRELGFSDIQTLCGAEQVSAFFATLGYNTDARIIQNPANLGITGETITRAIKNIELIADEDSWLQVYLVELSTVNVANTRELVRALRDRAGEYLLVLTSDYERIDFVLLERMPPEGAATGMAKKRNVAVQPHVLTVHRCKPTAVQLRVLRRLSYTESHPFYQYLKLKSAFSIAYWSEEYFNNRALFSDYYLNTRLRDEHPEWREDPKPAFAKFKALFNQATQKWAGKTEDTLRTELYTPAFDVLGFKAVAKKTSDSDAPEPDYFLYSDTNGSQPLALCLTYPWARSLDGKDSERDNDTPNENPGAVVVSLLESGIAPFAITTNGKLWRLYSARTHFPAGHYYEIDLEEILADTGPLANDPANSFRYFWLFFREQAFKPIETIVDGEKRSSTFLDTLIDGSSEFAKSLGDRLKDRVFDSIFPCFARGFIENIRQQDGDSADLSQPMLDAVFQGTLTFLYRLLFLLYAESRDLLPVREERGYFAKSLAKIKTEIAEHGGNILDEVPGLLRKTYNANSTELYDNLMDLFAVIDQGDSSLNVPVYNGGLFITQPEPDDDTPEAINARFLKQYKIPDTWLAIGIDLMTRDVDNKSHALVFIDYKSLGVRHLGSIYEGLLEFKLRIATEKMAIVKGKKTEEIIPYKEAHKKKLKVLTKGAGKNKQERIYNPGDVYIENDKQERKATGSYYTPDYIVKYIVEHTIGPVLDEKFEALQPEIREAQKAYHNAKKKNEALKKMGVSDDPDKVAHTYRHVVDELFDIKVLDPAMGSGHFLVEAVDYITKRMIAFLNAFPWNPVIAHIGKTRKTILSEMEKQNVNIDARKLTDVNLMKRHVLKRCVYGVDLNPMAVELAKVSLWLDCFTLGAPLSFLDHHLKCGNSLIGVSVDEVKDIVEGSYAQTMDLFGSRFAGLMLATDLMRQVGELSDATASQVKESRTQYKTASDKLKPFKRILDVYTSQWFWEASVSKRKKGVINPVVGFLRTEEAGQWLVGEKQDASLSTHADEIVSKAIETAQKKRFFHWELEFPEVFFVSHKSVAKDVEKKAHPGFDAVIGNPPYVRQEGLGDDKSFFQIAHESVYAGVADLYVYFYHLGLTVSRTNGFFGMITSNKYLRAGYGKAIRTFLKEYCIMDMIDFHDLPVFPDATAYPLVFIAKNSTPDADHLIRTHKVENLSDASHIDMIIREKAESINISRLNDDAWQLGSRDVRRLLDKIAAAGNLLGEVVKGKFYYGIKTGFNEAFVIDEGKRQELVKADPKSEEIIVPFLRGRDIKRWTVEWAGLYLIKTEIGVDIRRYPAVFKHLKENEKQLEKRYDKGKHWWELRACDYYKEFEKPKIIWPDISPSCNFAFDDAGHFLVNTAYIMPTDDLSLLALLNSSLVNFFYTMTCSQVRGGYLRFIASYMENIPIVDLPEEQRKVLSNHVHEIMDNQNNQSAVCEIEANINEIVFNAYSLSQAQRMLIKKGNK